MFSSQCGIVTLVVMGLKTELQKRNRLGVQMTTIKNITEIQLAVEGGRGPPEKQRERFFDVQFI